MKCPKCGTDLEITHSLEAGDVCRTQRLQCPSCLTTAITALVIVSIDPPRGQGMEAIRRALRQAGLDAKYKLPEIGSKVHP